ncbi:MAG: hypothetical protein ACLFRP_02615 [Puniceicoccaceae bacterium]
MGNADKAIETILKDESLREQAVRLIMADDRPGLEALAAEVGHPASYDELRQAFEHGEYSLEEEDFEMDLEDEELAGVVGGKE